MKKLNLFNQILITVLLIISTLFANGQVAINTTGYEASPSAMLDVSSTTKGLLIPRMTQEQRETIQNPTTGLLVYQTDNTTGFYYYNDSWIKLNSEGDSWSLEGNTGTNPNQNFIGTTDAQDLKFRVNNQLSLTLTRSGQIEPENTGGSVFLGNAAGEHDDHSYNHNTFIGNHAGYRNTSGSKNTVTGDYALGNNVTGVNNSAYGDHSLRNNTTGGNNSGFGFQTLFSNLTGDFNSAFGNYSLYSDTSGIYNTAVGISALRANLSGNYSVAVGSYSLYSSLGNYNIGIGYSSGYNITKGSNNILIGKQAYAPVDSADYQLNIGNLIYANNINGRMNILSSGNVGIGVKNPSAKLEVAGQVKITGGNPADGKVLQSNADGLASWEELTIVHDELYDTDSNTIIQVEKNSNEDKIRFDLGGTEYFVFDEGRIEIKNTGYSVFIGDNAGSSDDLSSNLNVFVGYAAGHSNTSGYNNTALGYSALYKNVSGNNNTAIGTGSLMNNTGNSNSAVGVNALKSNTSGTQNIALGYFALQSNNIGYNNTALGTSSLFSNTSGHENAAIGNFSMNSNTTGSKNTALGDGSLLHCTTGTNNISIGYSASSNLTTGSNNIIIGSDISALSASGSNTLNIGNLIFANDMDGVDSTISTGNIGIGVKNPTARLEVNGQVKITGGSPADGKVLQCNSDGLASWETLPADIDIHDELYDADSNTLIQVEKNSNEDKIRFEMGGTEYFVFDHSKLYIKNSGESVFLGDEAGLNDDLSSNKNTFTGYQSGKTNINGYDNAAYGYQSLLNCTGSKNVAFGKSAGSSITSGWYNIMIGYNTQPTVATGSNQLNIGNIIYGTGISLTTPKIGIGVTNPAEKLDILGNFQVKQTGSSVYANIESSTAGASLYLKAAGSTLAQVKFYDNGSYGGSIGYDNDEDRIFFYHHGNIFVKDGNLLPGSHKGSDLGLNGMAWDDIYYDDLFNQGAASFTNRDVTTEIVNHPPKAKAAGSFDDKTDRGEAELDPVSLPDGLHQNNAILTDELTTYNYKTNYEQQLLINAQEKTIKQQQQTINQLQQKILEMETLKQRLDKIEKLISEKE